MLRPLIAAIALLAGVPLTPQLLPASPAGHASGPDCDRDQATGKCRLQVQDGGHPPTTAVSTKPGSTKPGGSRCVFKGQVLPCGTADGFFDAASGCYLTPIDAPRSLFNPNDPSKYPPGTKFYDCWVILDVVDGKPEGIEKFESVIRRPGLTRTIDPREAARRVVATMKFFAPQLGVSPYVQSANHVGIVNVPIWMWVTDPGATTTGPQTKRAAIEGVGIEAVGTVERIEWTMGAGKTVTCKGAGTAFTNAMAAGKSLKDMPVSPTCGYKYAKTSRCEEGGAFTVTATAYWNVHWIGGGMQGDIPLDFSRSIPLPVTDLRPVLVDPDGGSSTPSVAPPSCGN